MSTTFIIQVILTGIGAGLFAGMFGIGGGIVILPVLIFLFHWDFHSATGTSLATLLLPTGFTALNNYRKSELLYIKGSAFIALGMFFGSALGATLSLYIIKDGALLKSLFGLYMIIVGVKYLRPVHVIKQLFSLENKPNPLIEFRIVASVPFAYYIVIGLFAGLLAGLFGIGGGLIITVSLIEIFGINPKQAVAMSLAAMFLPVGLVGVFLYNDSGNVHILAAILIAVGIEIGSAVSSRLSIKLSNSILKQFFGFFLILCGIYFAIERYLYI